MIVLLAFALLVFLPLYAVAEATHKAISKNK